MNDPPSDYDRGYAAALNAVSTWALVRRLQWIRTRHPIYAALALELLAIVRAESPCSN